MAGKIFSLMLPVAVGAGLAGTLANEAEESCKQSGCIGSGDKISNRTPPLERTQSKTAPSHYILRGYATRIKEERVSLLKARNTHLLRILASPSLSEPIDQEGKRPAVQHAVAPLCAFRVFLHHPELVISSSS